MKRTLEILILIAVIASVGALAGCTPDGGTPPPEPDPPKALAAPAEASAEADAEFWRTAAALLLAGLCAAFIGGTAVGSKAKRHASS